MDNNNNNHNGKEVPRDETLRNGQKENSRQPVNRIKKNNITADKNMSSDEVKKIPLNTNRQQGNPKRSTSKGHVIKLEDKANRVQPEGTTPRQNRRPYPKNARTNTTNSTNTTDTRVVEAPSYNQINRNNASKTSAERFTISDKTSQWLLIAAVILFVAWAVVFFYYHIGGNSHMILAFAVLCAIISLAGKRKKI